MKKAITLFLALLMVLSLAACGGGSTSGSQGKANEGPSDDDLKKAAEYLKNAEDDIITTASLQLDGWSKYSDITGYYFDDNGPDQVSESSIKNRAINAKNYRASARENLDKAKELIGTNGTGDFYNAVKDYYKCVNKFFALISTFPEGYSKITFSSAVADYKSECQSAYEEVKFYT